VWEQLIDVLDNDFPAEVRRVSVFQKIEVGRKSAAERYQTETGEVYSFLRRKETWIE
jgi:hypothetical protein